MIIVKYTPLSWFQTLIACHKFINLEEMVDSFNNHHKREWSLGHFALSESNVDLLLQNAELLVGELFATPTTTANPLVLLLSESSDITIFKLIVN